MLAAACFYAPVQAQPLPTPSLKFSLREARDYALNNSPVLLNSARDVEIAKKKTWEYTTIGLPQATFSATYSYGPELAGFSGELGNFFPPGMDTLMGGSNPFLSMDPNDLKTNFFSTIQVSQLIFSGQYLIGLKASRVYASLSELAKTKSEIDMAESITNTYFTALIARELKKTLDSSLTVLEKTRYETEQLYKNGFAEATDADQLQILVGNVKSALSVSVRQIALVDRLLKFQMGIGIDQTIELTDQLSSLTEVINLEAVALDTFSLDENISYQLLTTQEKLMQLNMKVNKVQFLPVLAGFYQRYNSHDDNFFNDQSPDMFGLSLNFPLFTSGQRISQVQQSKLEYLKAQTNTQMAAESLLLQYESAISEFLSAKDIYRLQTDNRNLSRRIYYKSLVKYKEGVGSSLEVYQTQMQYFESESGYFSAIMSLVSAKTKLESLLTKSVNIK
jgi:outer membrane protein TolC